MRAVARVDPAKQGLICSNLQSSSFLSKMHTRVVLRFVPEKPVVSKYLVTRGALLDRSSDIQDSPLVSMFLLLVITNVQRPKGRTTTPQLVVLS